MAPPALMPGGRRRPGHRSEVFPLVSPGSVPAEPTDGVVPGLVGACRSDPTTSVDLRDAPEARLVMDTPDGACLTALGQMPETWHSSPDAQEPTGVTARTGAPAAR